jgi:hypothetical protein
MEDGALEYLCFLQGIGNKYFMASLDEVGIVAKSDQRKIYLAWISLVMVVICGSFFIFWITVLL